MQHSPCRWQYRHKFYSSKRFLHTKTLRCIISIDEVDTEMSIKMFRYRSGVNGHDAIFMETDLNIDSSSRPHKTTDSPTQPQTAQKWPLSSSAPSAQPPTRPSPPCAQPKLPPSVASSPRPPSNLAFASAQKLPTSRPRRPQATSTSTNGSMANGRFCSRTRRTSRPCAPPSWEPSLSSEANSRREASR